MTNIRSVMGSMDLDELLSNREVINDRLLKVVDEAVRPWGIKVTRVEIKDIQPPADLVDAMGRQMKAEREKRAQVLEAEGFRNAQILRAEGAKQSAILEAEGQREAAYREAEARERLAEAEAKATRAVSEAIAAGDVNAINYFVAQKYTEALAAIGTAGNSKIVLMPMEASALIGSLGGIGAIAREVFGDQPPARPAAPAAAPRVTTPARTTPAVNPFGPPARHNDDGPHHNRTRPMELVGSGHAAARGRTADARRLPCLDRARRTGDRCALLLLWDFAVWTWQVQALFFAAAAVLFTLMGRRHFARTDIGSDETAAQPARRKPCRAHGNPCRTDPRRSRPHPPRRHLWIVSGPDLPAGTQVRVIASNGRDLTVEQV